MFQIDVGLYWQRSGNKNVCACVRVGVGWHTTRLKKHFHYDAAYHISDPSRTYSRKEFKSFCILLIITKLQAFSDVEQKGSKIITPKQIQ